MLSKKRELYRHPSPPHSLENLGFKYRMFKIIQLHEISSLLLLPGERKSRSMCTVIFPKVCESSLISAVPVVTFLLFGLLSPSRREKKNPWYSQFKFHFCQISVNTSISLDHPKCILFWWLIFHVISKQKDNTDKSSTKTCHGTRYWKKKRHWNRPKQKYNGFIIWAFSSKERKKQG